MATQAKRGYWDSDYWTHNFWHGRYWPGHAVSKAALTRLLLAREEEKLPLLDVAYDAEIVLELAISASTEFIPYVEKKKTESELYLLDDFWLFEDE